MLCAPSWGFIMWNSLCQWIQYLQSSPGELILSFRAACPFLMFYECWTLIPWYSTWQATESKPAAFGFYPFSCTENTDAAMQKVLFLFLHAMNNKEGWGHRWRDGCQIVILLWHGSLYSDKLDSCLASKSFFFFFFTINSSRLILFGNVKNIILFFELITCSGKTYFYLFFTQRMLEMKERRRRNALLIISALTYTTG